MNSVNSCRVSLTGKRLVQTNGFVRLLGRLVKDKKIGANIVPIVPDESRTFGMEGMFREIGIYAHAGQLYEPIDSDQVAYYKEARDGQILEEGITEARIDEQFQCGGNCILRTWHQHDSVLYLLFHVWIPARG